MLASQVSFESMMRIAAGRRELAFATSYLQVEYGLDDLRACWDGFVHTSDDYGQEFKSRKAVCGEFSYALNEYIECLGESIHLKVGP
jgi:hypothetical protein